MYVFLPAKDSGLEKFYRELTAENWSRWMLKFRPREGTVTMPRFKIEYEKLLNDALKALGMEVAFDHRANFDKMCPNVFISKVKHKSFVEVNEKGTEAAAATSVEVMVKGMPRPTKEFFMLIDRPFFFVIRDNATDTILFMGSIVDPKASSYK